jgi:MFS family permease
LAVLAVAMVLGMAPWFSATAVAPALVAAWHATAATAAWLTMAVQLGFVVGTLTSALLVLADRWSARRLAAGSAGLAALATGALAIGASGPDTAIALRGLTGFALAGVYPPGMKLVAGWWKDRRGMAIGVLVGALTLGSASPNLLRVLVDPANWRSVLTLAALSSAIAGVLFLRFAREGPYQAPSVPFDPRALQRVATNRGVVLATAGYLGHMWELYAMWSSIGLFWLAVAARRGLPGTTASLLAFTTIALGAMGCVVAGVYADRIGRARVTIMAMGVSGLCALVIGTLIDAPLSILVVVATIWGISVIADSAQFSACVTELAPSEYVGTALTLQTSLGFLLTLVTIRLVPVWAASWGWERAYMPLALGPAAGIVAMWRLGRASQGR